MEFFRKSFLIFLFIFISCSRDNLLKNSEVIEINVKQLEIWFDAMPKINGSSHLHCVLDMDLKNLLNRKIELDSINLEVLVDEVLKIRFDTEKFSPKLISPNTSENFQLNFSSNELKDFRNLKSKKSKVFMNLIFNSNSNSFNKEFLIGETEIQVVY